MQDEPIIIIDVYRHFTKPLFLAIGRNLVGLVVEAGSLDDLNDIIQDVIPDLVDANGVVPVGEMSPIAPLPSDGEQSPHARWNMPVPAGVLKDFNHNRHLPC